MKKFFVQILIAGFIVACGTQQKEQSKSDTFRKLPIGNNIISHHNETLEKDQIGKLQIEYAGLYDSTASNQTCPDLDKSASLISKSYYFTQEQTKFYDMLDKAHTFSCMGLLEAKDKTYDLHIIKSVPAHTDVAEGRGYGKYMYLISVSKKTNQIVDVLNIYNDGIVLYWECMRFFYIDSDLSIHLKDISINEGAYKVLNQLSFGIDQEGHIVQKKTTTLTNLSPIDSSKADTWKGVYVFKENVMRGMDEFQVNYTLDIDSQKRQKCLYK